MKKMHFGNCVSLAAV